MSAQPDAVTQSWFDEVWNQGREDTIDQLFASDAIAHGLPGGTLRGPASDRTGRRRAVDSRTLRAQTPDAAAPLQIVSSQHAPAVGEKRVVRSVSSFASGARYLTRCRSSASRFITRCTSFAAASSGISGIMSRRFPSADTL